MLFRRVLLQALVWAGLGVQTVVLGQNATSQWPLHTDGLTNLVEWDHYSFMVNGERLFVFSGEFHYWRLPVPELWQDLLEKVKAAGFTAFSIYVHWGFHNPAPGTLDFETAAHNFSSIMTLAKDLGMYMIVRPGPYINAETNAGGYPLWLTTGAYGELRTDDSRYTAAWTPYWTAVAEAVSPHLITNGGHVILFQVENELNGQFIDDVTRTPNIPIDDYFELLETTARDNGINVPFSYNAPNMNAYAWSKDYSNVTGNVDVVGLDSYPSCWSCNLSECTGTNGAYVAYQVIDYDGYFAVQSPTQPNFMHEFQGGSYNPWGGPQGGCPNDIGPDFANMFYRNLIYQRITAVSLYMLYGGTNVGWLACPVVATSYDYSSPVSENRTLWSKYYETKLVTLFTRSARDLPMTDLKGNGTYYTSDAAITTAELRNPETNAAFYVTMHAYSPSSTLETFTLNVNTSEGLLTIPRYGGSIAIDGHQAKIIVTDFSYGNRTLLYSTAEVLTYAIVDGKEVLALWVPTGESGEFTVNGVTSATATGADGSGSATSSSSLAIHPGASNVTVAFTQQQGMTVVDLSDGSRVVLLDRTAAYLFWAPSLGNDPTAPANESILVQGPYLVRSAALDTSTNTLSLAGDLDGATTIHVFAPSSASTVTWNGESMAITSNNGGLLTASLEGPTSFTLPSLGPWKYFDSLPEILPVYIPSPNTWIDANHTNTSNPTVPDLHNPVLYVDDYGIHVGNHIYHATFPTTKSAPTGVFLNITGGTAFGYSAWLNGHFIGSYLGLSYSETGMLSLSFANATLTPAGSIIDNVLVVLMDNSGHDEEAAAINPRGIYNATLLGPADRSTGGPGYAFSSWKIAGTAGTARGIAAIDPVRGVLSEGGLFAERLGMQLPEFPDALWPGSATLSVPGAGVRVFRTEATLQVPDGLDPSVSFRLTVPSASPSNAVRALLFVNGYQYGRFNPYIGNQIDYPVPPGILNYAGPNTIAVTVWSQSAAGAEVLLEWNLEYVHTTGFDMKFDGTALRPGWTIDRLEYY